MQDRYRFWSTVVVWVAFTLIILAAIVAMSLAAVPEGAIVPILFGMMVLAGMAAASTYGIWQGAKPSQEQRRAETQAGKAKRTSQERIERLVEALDEDEIVELETLLLAREGEGGAGDTYR